MPLAPPAPKLRQRSEKHYDLLEPQNAPEALPAWNLACVMDDHANALRDAAIPLARLGFRVHQVQQMEDALYLAREHGVPFFVLDVNMGTGREWEGLRTAERLKAADPRVFVALLSGYSQNREIQRRARALKVDTVQEKTGDRAADVQQIIRAFSAVVKQRMEQLERGTGGEEPAHPDDPNVAAFQRYLADEAWTRSNVGKLAVFVHGELAGTFEDPATMVRVLAERFPGTDRFYARVGRDETGEPLDFPGFEIVDDE